MTNAERQAAYRSRLTPNERECYRAAARVRACAAYKRRQAVTQSYVEQQVSASAQSALYTMPLGLKTLVKDPCQSSRAVPTPGTTRKLSKPNPNQGVLAIGATQVLSIWNTQHLTARKAPKVVAKYGPVLDEPAWLKADELRTWAKWGAVLIAMGEITDPLAVANKLEPPVLTRPEPSLARIPSRTEDEMLAMWETLPDGWVRRRTA